MRLVLLMALGIAQAYAAAGCSHDYGDFRFARGGAAGAAAGHGGAAGANAGGGAGGGGAGTVAGSDAGLITDAAVD